MKNKRNNSRLTPADRSSRSESHQAMTSRTFRLYRDVFVCCNVVIVVGQMFKYHRIHSFRKLTTMTGVHARISRCVKVDHWHLFKVLVTYALTRRKWRRMDPNVIWGRAPRADDLYMYRWWLRMVNRSFVYVNDTTERSHEKSLQRTCSLKCMLGQLRLERNTFS